MERPRFGDYFVLAEVAQGGMGTVFKAKLGAHDASAGSTSHELFAIKCMHRFLNHGQFDALKAFQTEASLALQLQHSNIVRTFEAGDSLRGPYMVMEWLSGKTLREVIKRAQAMKTGFPAAFCANVAMKAAAALAYTHGRGVLHRDVSPQNIMITYDGRVKVIDFGIAKLRGQESTRSGVIKGKPSYLSPEQVEGSKVDERSDIFNIGIVLWEMLTQRKLFQGKTVVEIIRKISDCDTWIRRPSHYNPSVSAELDQVVMKALAQKPENRFRSADELRAALERFAMQESMAAESQAAFMNHLFAEEVRSLSEPDLEIDISLLVQPREPQAQPAEAAPAEAPIAVALPASAAAATPPPAPAALSAPTPSAVPARPSAPRRYTSSAASGLQLEWMPAPSQAPSRRAMSAEPYKSAPQRPLPAARAPDKHGRQQLMRELPAFRQTGPSSFAILGIAAAVLFFMAHSRMLQAPSPEQAEPQRSLASVNP